MGAGTASQDGINGLHRSKFSQFFDICPNLLTNFPEFG